MVEKICDGDRKHLLEIKEIRPLQTGIITTGNEVYHGRIKDSFTPVIREKLLQYGCKEIFQEILPDDAAQIAKKIKNFIDHGIELIIITGGMSVDADDVTPTGIKASGADLITYGAPVLPGAMFLLAYSGDVPILGLPACVMYFKATIFDLVLPRVLAGELIAKKELAMMGHGGLCLNCGECRFPMCSFGR